MGFERSQARERVARASRGGGSVSAISDGSPPRARMPEWLLPDASEHAARTCAFCGEEAPEGSAFCPRDGSALSATLVPAGGRSLTVLFTDIEDSVRLNERLGDALWAQLVDEHNLIVRAAIDRYAGFEVKSTGDGFLVAFSETAHAVFCAVSVQRAVSACARQRFDWPVRVRIGMHTGEVMLRMGGDILGRTVNVAERVLGKGAGDEIWLSERVYGEVASLVPEDRWVDRGMRRLRGLPGREHLFQLEWADDARFTPFTPPRVSQPAPALE